jgi:hypothetical protein
MEIETLVRERHAYSPLLTPLSSADDASCSILHEEVETRTHVSFVANDSHIGEDLSSSHCGTGPSLD